MNPAGRVISSAWWLTSSSTRLNPAARSRSRACRNPSASAHASNSATSTATRAPVRSHDPASASNAGERMAGTVRFRCSIGRPSLAQPTLVPSRSRSSTTARSIAGSSWATRCRNRNGSAVTCPNAAARASSAGSENRTSRNSGTMRIGPCRASSTAVCRSSSSRTSPVARLLKMVATAARSAPGSRPGLAARAGGHRPEKRPDQLRVRRKQPAAQQRVRIRPVRSEQPSPASSPSPCPRPSPGTAGQGRRSAA